MTVVNQLKARMTVWFCRPQLTGQRLIYYPVPSWLTRNASEASFELSMIRALLLRLQAFSVVKPGLRRWMLNMAGAQIHPTAVVERGCHVGHKLKLGAGSLLNAYAFFDNYDWLILEENARVAVRATIITRTHGIGDDPTCRSDHSCHMIAPVRIGRGATVGAGCIILPGADIAPGCVVGAGAIVTKPTLPNSVYFGGGAARWARALPAGDETH